MQGSNYFTCLRVCMLVSIYVVYRYISSADVIMECFDWNFWFGCGTPSNIIIIMSFRNEVPLPVQQGLKWIKRKTLLGRAPPVQARVVSSYWTVILSVYLCIEFDDDYYLCCDYYYSWCLSLRCFESVMCICTVVIFGNWSIHRIENR